MAHRKARRALRAHLAGCVVLAWASSAVSTCWSTLQLRRHTPHASGTLTSASWRRHSYRLAPRSVTLRAASGSSVLDYAGGWWNDTVEFWDALEIWNATPLREDTAPEALALVSQLDRLNSTLVQLRAERQAGAARPGAQAALAVILEKLPGLTGAYYAMRIARTFNKRAVKRGFSSSVLYVNVGLAAVFFRVVAPRLLAAGNLDELFDAASAVGIPDRATLAGMLDSLQGYDLVGKVGLYTLAFVLEKLTMVSEILPIQIGLKTLAPVIFGGLVQGAIGSAVAETLGALCNFAVGRAFLTERLREFSVFGSPPVGEAKWYGALSRAAEDDGFRLVLLLRLAPVLPLPFDSYWYLLGALPVGPGQFALGHFLGCLKTAFLDASFGMLLLTSVNPDTGSVQSQAQQVVLLETVAFTVVALLIGTVASKLATELLGLDEEEEKEQEAEESIKLEAAQQPPAVATASGSSSDVGTDPLLKGARRVD